MGTRESVQEVSATFAFRCQVYGSQMQRSCMIRTPLRSRHQA